MSNVERFGCCGNGVEELGNVKWSKNTVVDVGKMEGFCKVIVVWSRLALRS